MYTTNDADHATAALQVFEQVRSFFGQSNQAASVPDLPVKIIAFRSEGEYARYRLNPGAFAYYLHNYKHDYIVMQDINPEHYPAVIHEYTHLIVEHSGWKLPLWLNEGWAEVYSSLQSQGNQVVVGRVPVGRLADLRAGDWLSLQTILAVDHKSPYYQQPDKMRLFYAQSWALCHMLMLSPAYKPKFLSFVAAVSAGRPAADCFSAIYGKTLDQVQGDLTEYIGRAAQQTELLDVQLSSSESQPAVSPLSSFDRDLALSDLLGASAQTAGEARSLLTQLSKEQPGNAEVEESLGYLTWQQGNEQEVRLHFRRAFQNGSNDAMMLCEYASLVEASVQGDIAEGDSARSALLKALALPPNYIAARLPFALMEFRAGRYASTSATLTLTTTVKPEQAYCYYS
ncbi:MAG: tetratricopeptide repeat protein, partial [Segetibacter sp.]